MYSSIDDGCENYINEYYNNNNIIIIVIIYVSKNHVILTRVIRVIFMLLIFMDKINFCDYVIFRCVILYRNEI